MHVYHGTDDKDTALMKRCYFVLLGCKQLADEGVPQGSILGPLHNTESVGGSDVDYHQLLNPLQFVLCANKSKVINTESVPQYKHLGCYLISDPVLCH